MQSFRDTVKSAGLVLFAHPIGQEPHVRALWDRIEFRVQNEAHQADALASASEDAIHLYPALEQKEQPSQAESAVLREFGVLLLRKADSGAKQRWKLKLVLPTRAQIASVQSKLQDEDIRRRCQSYEEFLKTFSTAMDRLVCLNMTNALLANGVHWPNSVGIDLETFGATSNYAKMERYHSLVPFTSAYAPKNVHQNYGDAFAEMVVNKMRAVRESSTAKALESLIRDIALAAR